MSDAPSLVDKIKNLSVSLADAAKDGCKTVTKEQFWARIHVCDACPYRDGSACGVCGCQISVKAQLRAWKCPKDLWPKVEKDG